MTSIYVKEKAAQGTPTATYGQIWVENTVPASFHIEDDAGALAEVNVGTLIATTLTGTLSTAAQTNITSVGTLTSLAVTGAFSCGALTSTGIDDNATSEQLQISDTRIDCGQPLFILEAAAEETNVANYGQISVLNETPSAFYFTDDTGLGSMVYVGDLGVSNNSTSVIPYMYMKGQGDGATQFMGFEMYQYVAANIHPYQWSYKARGNYSTPAQITAGDTLWQMGATGRVAAGWGSTGWIMNIVSTTNTGNCEPTMVINTGTSGKMSLFADGHLEVYGPSGDVSEAWSGSAGDNVIHMKNNGNAYIALTVLDGTAGEGGISFNDSSADGQFTSGIQYYTGAHSTRAYDMELWCGRRMSFSATGPLNIKNGETVAALASPTPTVGDIARVTDANAPAVGSTVAGSGGAAALVWYNGSNWTVIGV